MSYRIRPAEPADIDLLAQWAQAMALETEHRQLDVDTVRAGVAAAIKPRRTISSRCRMRRLPAAKPSAWRSAR
jgi:hypothetical protein